MSDDPLRAELLDFFLAGIRPERSRGGGAQVAFRHGVEGDPKALATLAEHGPDRVAVIVHDRLMTGDVVAEAGLVAQAKAPRAV